MQLRIKSSDVESFLSSLSASRRRLVEQVAHREGQYLLLMGTREQVESVLGSLRIGPPPGRSPRSETAKPARVAVEKCLHRGEETDRVKCSTCAGTVFAKIHACDIHGRCTLFSRPIEGVRRCHGCADCALPAKPADTGQAD
jgi:hypothetical protein